MGPRFGGNCSSVELLDNRKSSASKFGREDAWQAEAGTLAEEMRLAYTDPYDQPLYEYVRERFEAQVADYGLTTAKCVAMGCMAEGDAVMKQTAYANTLY